MRANNQVVTVREGEAVELACSADRDLKQCTFKTAGGDFRAVRLYQIYKDLTEHPGVKFNRHFRDVPKPVINHVWSFDNSLLRKLSLHLSLNLALNHECLMNCTLELILKL